MGTPPNARIDLSVFICYTPQQLEERQILWGFTLLANNWRAVNPGKKLAR
jgi:hypothetical protein